MTVSEIVPMVIEKARVPTLPSESNARTLKDETPLPVGVPLMTPALLSVRPAGNAPADNVNV